MKKIGIGCLVIIGAIILFGIIGSASGGNKNQSGSPSQTAGQTGTKATPTEEPVMKITAREFVDAFEENQVAAEAKYNGKMVEFSAKITNITDSGLSFANEASKQFSLAQISCRIKDKNQLLTLKKEQTVTVRGRAGKQTIGVIDVSECMVVE